MNAPVPKSEIDKLLEKHVNCGHRDVDVKGEILCRTTVDGKLYRVLVVTAKCRYCGTTFLPESAKDDAINFQDSLYVLVRSTNALG